MLTIVLPFPDSKLSPNKRLCWQAKQKAKKAQRDAGIVAAMPYKNKIKKQLIYLINLTFVPPDNRHRDLDNLLSSSKQLLDGVAKGLGINDKQFNPIRIGLVVPKQNEQAKTILTIYDDN